MSWGSWISGKIFQTKNKYIYTLTEIHTFSEASSIACFSVVWEQLGRGWTHIHCCSYSGWCHSPFLFCPSVHLLRSYLLFSSKLLLWASSRPPLFIFNFVRVQASLNSFVIISTHSCLTFCSKVPQTNQAINFCNRSYFSSFAVFVLFLVFVSSILSPLSFAVVLYFLRSVF